MALRKMFPLSVVGVVVGVLLLSTGDVGVSL